MGVVCSSSRTKARPSQPGAQRDDIAQLPIPDPETELRYVMDAVRTVKSGLSNRVPLDRFSPAARGRWRPT